VAAGDAPGEDPGECLRPADGQPNIEPAEFANSIKSAGEPRRRVQYIINRDHDGVDRLKLLPTEADRPFFYSLVLHGKILEKDHRMAEAYRFFHNALSGLDLDGESIDPNRVFETLVSSLLVVMINLGESEDPYLIFESLNYKGEPLNQADLVSNYVLMRFRHSLEPGGEQEAVYLELWKPLEDSLGSALTEFLRHYAMKEGENIKTGGIYAALKRRLFAIAEPGDVKAELRQMRNHGDFYEMFLNPDRAPSPDLRKRLATLQGLEMTTAYPLLLRLFDAHHAEQLAEEELCACLDMIESFSVRRAVCNVPTNAHNKLFLQWARNFTGDRVFEWLTSQMLVGAGGRRWPTDAEFRTALLTQPQYGKKTTRHILVTLEGDYNHKERVDLSDATIEHVLPQTLTNSWRQQLGGDAQRVHGELVHTLGNLTLTCSNSELANRSFVEKQAQLANSHIELNRWICEQPQWAEQEIKGRSKLLAEAALSIWPRPAHGE
jgi:Protein of unknown function (DUF1524)